MRYQKEDVRADPEVAGYRYERYTSLKVITSNDNGKSWVRLMTVAGDTGSPATWGNLCALRNGNILALTTWQGRSWSRAIAGRSSEAQQ